MTKASAVIAPPSNSSTKDETQSIDARIAMVEAAGGDVMSAPIDVPSPHISHCLIFGY